MKKIIPLICMIISMSCSCTEPGENVAGQPTPQPTPFPKTFIKDASFSTTDGLADNNVRDVYYTAGEYYVATNGGISISVNNGEEWINTISPTIPNNQVYCIVLDGTTVYAGTFSGLTAGADKGSTSWSNYLAGESVNDLLIDNGTVYAATDNGLAIASTGDLSSWTYYTTNEGLAHNTVNCIFLSGTTLYIATEGGLSVTNTSFSSWVTYDNTDGMMEDSIDTVVASGQTIICGVNFAVNITANVGTDWTIDYSTGGGAVTGTVLEGTTVYVAKYGAPLYVSEDMGANWMDYDLPDSPVLGYNMNAVFVSAGTILVCHTTGLLQGHIE
jgi:hypothetical protein